MIDLDEIERRASACECSKVKVCNIKSSTLLDLVERTRQAEKDAARYQWLRKSSGADSKQHWLHFLYSNERLDQAIDEAMQCSK